MKKRKGKQSPQVALSLTHSTPLDAHTRIRLSSLAGESVRERERESVVLRMMEEAGREAQASVPHLSLSPSIQLLVADALGERASEVAETTREEERERER